MPIHKVKLPDGSMGYQWGRTGKKYKDLEDARRQERAIYASGWREEGESKKANAKRVCDMNYKEWLQKQDYNAENSGTNLINLYQGGRGLLTAGGAAADALTLAALLHGATTGNRATGTIGGAILGSGIGSGLLGGAAKAITSAGNDVGTPVAAGVVGSTVGGLGGLIGGGTIGYILSNAAKKRREKMERLELRDDIARKVSGRPAAKTASLNKSAAHQLAVIIKTAQLKNAESAVQLPKAIQPTGVTGPTMPKTYPSMPKAYKPMPTVPKATAQPVAPAKAPAAIKSPAAAKPAYQQEPDLGGTRTVQPGDTGWKYWKELGGNRHMPYNDWVREFQAANPDIDINKLIPGTVVGLGRSVE